MRKGTMGELGIYGLQSEAHSFASVTELLLTAMETCHPHLGLRGHAERVAHCALQLARQMGVGVIERDYLHYGALLHDIGKIAIPGSILFKSTGLERWEWDEIKQHPLQGERICQPLGVAPSILHFIRSHHEKLDGSGYPDGLAGDAIPLTVQILAVANVYDALCSERSYRAPFEHDDAIDVLRSEVTRGWWNSEAVELMDGCGQEFKIC